MCKLPRGTAVHTNILCLTMYPPEAVRQVIFAVDCLVTGSDVTEVAGFLKTVWWGKGFQGKEAVVTVYLRRHS